jgi:hypothetical protein
MGIHGCEDKLTRKKVLDEPENEITITVFRLLVLDLLSLFQVLNQAMINILGILISPFLSSWTPY